MTEPTRTPAQSRPAGPSRSAETLMLFVFAVLCAMLGGLLHLAAGMPAGTAALSALASVSLVVAANAVIRRRVMVSALNAEIAELRVEINGLRSARGAPPVSRTPYPAPIREPVPAGRGAAVDPSAVRLAGAPRGAYQPGPTAHSRPAALPPALQPPHGAASKPVLGAERPPQHSPHVMAAHPGMAQEPGHQRDPVEAPANRESRQPQSPQEAKLDWTLRPGEHREPTARLPSDTPQPAGTGPLPLLVPSAQGPASPPLVSPATPSKSGGATPKAPQASESAAAAPPRAAPSGEAMQPVPERVVNAQPGIAPAVPAMATATTPSPAIIAPDRVPTQQSDLKAPRIPPVDELQMPPSDSAPRAMSRPDTAAWPQAVPKSPTGPLDLDTMQNLIEQLAGQLHQPPPLAAADVAEAPARKHPAVFSDRAPRPSLPAGAHPQASPAEPHPLAPSPDRAPTPFAHLALIAEAVEANRMDVMIDPILGLSDRRARHFELSMRLRTGADRDLGEADYAPVAAGTGLLGRIDARKLERAADVLQRLRARGSGASLFSSVAGESLEDDNFANAFAEVLAAEEGSASRLVLTFQQAEARTFTDAHWRAISDMARIGLKFALTGVTDLDMDFENLKRHGFDFIKLDAAVFLEGLPTPTGTIPAADICRHLAGMGLGLIVGGIVAEKDLARILGFGALLGQGALFGGPRSVEIERERRAA